ncbi:MAG: helix-turn-helix transcriptional regulator [Dehalococcoidales bacterium]|nr:helix-turn-helix transcriptional regulator [Dehalococcoidales bacterium]
MTFGSRIKQLRKQKRMSQYDLEDASGVKRTTINYYESSGPKTKPDKENLFLIAQALGIDPNELYALAGYSHEKVITISPDMLATKVGRVLDNMVPVYADLKETEIVDYICLSFDAPIPRSWKAYRNPSSNQTIIVDSSVRDYKLNALVISGDNAGFTIQYAKDCIPAVPGIVVAAINKYI